MTPTYISVDVETSGPIPARYALLSIGACVVSDPEQSFYVELQPEHAAVDPEALAVSGLSMEQLHSVGEPPATALPRFAEWVERATPADSIPVFVAFNAPFDWMFVADALHRHVGRNPFGHAALDVKALAMGTTGGAWFETSFARLADRYGLSGALPHHALKDAKIQATLFERILDNQPGGTP